MAKKAPEWLTMISKSSMTRTRAISGQSRRAILAKRGGAKSYMTISNRA